MRNTTYVVVLKDTSELWSTYKSQDIPDIYAILALGNMHSIYVYTYRGRYPVLLERYSTIIEYPIDLSTPERVEREE